MNRRTISTTAQESWTRSDRTHQGDPIVAQSATNITTGTEVYYLPEIAAVSRKLNAPENRAEDDIAVVQGLIAIYRRNNSGSVPDGFYNNEITAILRGRNAKHFSVLAPDLPGSAINANGELQDRWGTPYFFHPVSRELIEVRSAGPDRRFWTGDDIQSPDVVPG
ncbi:MAG TPA: hypothetical protein VIT21_09340 [Chthoniobacterales bacterium]